MAPQKTYWHLLPQKRMPTEYELVTSKLLCYTGEGFTGKRFELDVPLLDWYKRYQQDSPLTCTSWDTFRDPRERRQKCVEVREKKILSTVSWKWLRQPVSSLAACPVSRRCSVAISARRSPDAGVLCRTNGSERTHCHHGNPAGRR